MSATLDPTARKSVAMSFVATSNNVKATGSERESKPLRMVVEQSKAFKKAFEGSTSQPRMIQSSTSDDTKAVAGEYGLVSAIMEAYNEHHCLVLRPDDVWQAILTQFSFYVNANAEALRDSFVDFQGKKTLVITMPGRDLFSINFGTFANRMVDEQITANIKDPEVTKWLLPNFTTTKSEDRVAASVTIMSTLQAYFVYRCCIRCGIPKVTLEGTPTDWNQLRQKIDRLLQYDVVGKGAVMKKWHSLLAPVLDHFVASAEGRPELKFWDTVCSHSGGGSGPSYLSGWVTVFSCFQAGGTWQGEVPERPRGGYGRERNAEVKWPFIDTGAIPGGAVSVPVIVDDNGTEYKTQMIAGQFGFEMTGNNDTVRPRTDWCIAYEPSPKT
jgi:hypothetical protein